MLKKENEWSDVRKALLDPTGSVTVSTDRLRSVLRQILPANERLPCVTLNSSGQPLSWFVYNPTGQNWMSVMPQLLFDSIRTYARLVAVLESMDPANRVNNDCMGDLAKRLIAYLIRVARNDTSDPLKLDPREWRLHADSPDDDIMNVFQTSVS